MRQRDLELLIQAFMNGMEWEAFRTSNVQRDRGVYRRLLEFGVEVGKERGMKIQRDAHEKRRKR